MLLRPPARRETRTILLALVPWLWFPIRDHLGFVTDVLAIALPVAATVVAVALVALRRRGAVVLAASLLVLAAVGTVAPWVPADLGGVSAGQGIRVVGANVTGAAAVGPLLRAESPDVAVVLEMPPEMVPEFEAAYPEHFYHYQDHGLTIGFFSRLPVRSLERPHAGLPGVRAEIDGPAGRFVVYGLHVPRPWITRAADQDTVLGHQRLLADLAARIAAEPLPVVVVGDLNATDRGRGYRTLLGVGGLGDAMRETWAAPTSVSKWAVLLLRIDHVLVDRGWCGDGGRRIGLLGTDHRANVVTVGPCATAS